MQAGYGGQNNVQGGYYQPSPYGPRTLEQWLEGYHKKVDIRRKHINALSIVLLIIAALYILSGIGFGVFFITAPAWDPNIKPDEKIFLPVVGVFFLIFFILLGVWPAINAWALKRRKEWGRWSTVIFCAFTSPLACGSICCLPVTIWGIWALIGPEADGVFGSEPKPPPHLVPADPSQRDRKATPVDTTKTDAQAQRQAAGAVAVAGVAAGASEKDKQEPQTGYGETAKPSGRTPIPHIYPRPRVSSKTPPEGLYRYEPKTPRQPVPVYDSKERPQSYSNIPTVQDVMKPKIDKDKK